MDKNVIADFFDNLAPTWDDAQIRNEEVIEMILDKGGIFEDKCVLDVACGTGVLFPDYIKRGVEVTGVDISDEMIKIAKNKFPQTELICADAETYHFEKQFDAVMIYNAFPHFVNPAMLFENLAKALKNNGRFTVAHGISEKELEKCHSQAAKSVSQPLPSKEKLARMMSEFFDVDIFISDDKMYMVSGTKKQ